MAPVSPLGSRHVLLVSDVEAARGFTDVRFFAGSAVVFVDSLLFLPIRSRFIPSAEDVLKFLTCSDECVTAGFL